MNQRIKNVFYYVAYDENKVIYIDNSQSVSS